MKKHDKGSPKVRSSVVIARLLASEGFNEYVASVARSYWRRSIASKTERAQNRIKKIDAAFKESVSSQLTETQKQILGKFISLRERMAFDTGFRVGFMTTMYPEKHRTEEVKPLTAKGMDTGA